jgi:hypothetical protein
MLSYIYGHDQIVSQFVAALIPHCRRGFGPNIKTLGVVDNGDGSLVAGIVWHNWDPEAQILEISGAAIPGAQWLTRETLKHMYRFPFHVCNCQMVVQRTPADDERLLYMLSRYDYAFVTVPRLFGRHRDGVVCMLTREAWENNRFNKRLKHHVKDAQPPIEEAA